MSLGDWLSDYAFMPSEDLTQAQDAANIITDKTTAIVVQRPGAGGTFTDLPEQIVRLETMGSPRNVDGGLTVSGPQQILVVGFRGHPEIANTDIRRNDKFFVDGITYTITALLVDTRVSLQAIGEAKP